VTAAIVVYVLAALTVALMSGGWPLIGILWPLILLSFVATEIAVAWSNWTYTREQKKRAARGGKS